MSDVQWQLGEKDARFLESIRYYSGEASTRQIRMRSGLSPSAVNHRFEKMEKLGLIHKPHTRPYQGKKMKVAVWTDKLEDEIKNGLLNRLDYNLTHSQEIHNLRNEVRDLREEVSRLENRLNSMNTSVDDNRSDIEDTEARLSDWSDRVHDRLGALAQAILNGTDEDPAEFLES